MDQLHGLDQAIIDLCEDSSWERAFVSSPLKSAFYVSLLERELWSALTWRLRQTLARRDGAVYIPQTSTALRNFYRSVGSLPLVTSGPVGNHLRTTTRPAAAWRKNPKM